LLSLLLQLLSLLLLFLLLLAQPLLLLLLLLLTLPLQCLELLLLTLLLLELLPVFVQLTLAVQLLKLEALLLQCLQLLPLLLQLLPLLQFPKLSLPRPLTILSCPLLWRGRSLRARLLGPVLLEPVQLGESRGPILSLHPEAAVLLYNGGTLVLLATRSANFLLPRRLLLLPRRLLLLRRQWRGTRKSGGLGKERELIFGGLCQSRELPAQPIPASRCFQH